MSSDIAVMSSKLLELKMKAGALRTEVELLHSTKHTLDMNAVTASKAEKLRESSEEAKHNDGKAEEACADIENTPKNAKNRKKHSVIADYTLPSEYVNEIQAKAGEVRVVMLKHKTLTREKRDVQTLLDRAITRNQESEQEYVRLMELAGVQSFGGRSQHLNKIEQVNYFNSLLKETAQLYEQRDLLQTQLKEQTNELERLSMLLEESTKAREQEQEARHILEMKMVKVNELRLTRERLERAIASKDQILAKPNRGPTAEDYVKAATQDRRVALLELTRERNYVSENEKAIEHRALQIAKLEKRLEMIGDIIAGDDLDDVEAADVELIDALTNEISALHKVCDETNARITIMDAEIEKLDEKVRSFQRSTMAANKEMDKIEANHEQYVKTVNSELKRAEILTEDIIIEKREIDQLRAVCEEDTHLEVKNKVHEPKTDVPTQLQTPKHSSKFAKEEHNEINSVNQFCLTNSTEKLGAPCTVDDKNNQTEEMDSIEFENISEEDKGKVNSVNKFDSCNDNELNIQDINSGQFSEQKGSSEIEFLEQPNSSHVPVTIQPEQQTGMHVNNDSGNVIDNEIEFKEVVEVESAHHVKDIIIKSN